MIVRQKEVVNTFKVGSRGKIEQKERERVCMPRKKLRERNKSFGLLIEIIEGINGYHSFSYMVNK